jgi:hypothetical protein
VTPGSLSHPAAGESGQGWQTGIFFDSGDLPLPLTGASGFSQSTCD